MVICTKCGFCHAYGSRYGVAGYLCYHPDNKIEKIDYVTGKTIINTPNCKYTNTDGKCDKFQPKPEDTRSWWKKFLFPHSPYKPWKLKVEGK